MGLVVVGFGLLDICLWYLILDKLVYTADNMQNGLHMLGMTFVPAGCSTAISAGTISTAPMSADEPEGRGRPR